MAAGAASLLPARASPTGRNRNTIKLSQKTRYRKCNYSKIQINVQRKLAPDRVSQASKSSWRQAALGWFTTRRRPQSRRSPASASWLGHSRVHPASQDTQGEEQLVGGCAGQWSRSPGTGAVGRHGTDHGRKAERQRKGQTGLRHCRKNTDWVSSRLSTLLIQEATGRRPTSLQHQLLGEKCCLLTATAAAPFLHQAWEVPGSSGAFEPVLGERKHLWWKGACEVWCLARMVPSLWEPDRY